MTLISRKVVPSSAILAMSSGLIFGIPSSSAADDEVPVLGTANAESDDLGQSTIEVNEATRSTESDFVTITWTFRNNTGKEYDAKDLGNTLYPYNDYSVSGVTALDEKAKIRYHPIQDSEEFCLCAGQFYPHDFREKIPNGASGTYWTSYMIPSETNEITIEVPGFESLEGVTIE
ncbi:hypothetical protein [Nocardiopsis halophila]|uniref:hypothetical protein n=1 Tax=Nocardiopsis halophila TaxID=141692 RepID=UPI0012696AFD|nr:hypothetical protein [Nocardiopsis halophila]